MSENILGYFEFNEILILEQEININGHHLVERTEKSLIYGMSKIITNERKIDEKSYKITENFMKFTNFGRFTTSSLDRTVETELNTKEVKEFNENWEKLWNPSSKYLRIELK